MIDPFTAWMRMASASLEMSRTGLRLAETMAASRDVVEARTAMMRSGVAATAAERAELARMVPEKVDAFSRSGSAMAREWVSLQADWMAGMQQLGTAMLSGRVPTPADAMAIAARSQAHGLRMVESAAAMAGVGLAPIHRRATANQRRLKRRRK